MTFRSWYVLIDDIFTDPGWFMIQEMRRLYPRGAGNRGVCVDADGAMLGAEWVLVRRTPRGCEALARDDAVNLQKCVLGGERDPDWLFLYVDQLRAFDALKWGDVKIVEQQIKGKVLDIVVPKNSGTLAQRQAIATATERARRLGVHILISPY